jgi:hypothetical protein
MSKLLVLAVRTVSPKALYREVDQAWVQGAQRLVAEAHLLHPARRLVLGDHVCAPDHVEEHGLALRALEIERHALLVRVEEEEVAAVDARLLRAAVTARLAPAGLLDLDDVGAEPREQLRARGAGFELGEVEHADAVQRGAHGRNLITFARDRISASDVQYGEA